MCFSTSMRLAPASTLSAVQLAQLDGRQCARRFDRYPTLRSSQKTPRSALPWPMRPGSAREDAAIAALAAALDGARDLVDELLRHRLRHPSDATKFGIDALLAPEFTTTAVSHPPTAEIAPADPVDAALWAKVGEADAAVDDLIVRLYKSLLVCNALKLTSADLRLLRASATAATGFIGAGLQHAAGGGQRAAREHQRASSSCWHWRGCAALRRTAPTSCIDTFSRPALLLVWNAATARAVLATGFALTEVEVKAAADQIGLTTDDRFRDPIAVDQIGRALARAEEARCDGGVWRPC